MGIDSGLHNSLSGSWMKVIGNNGLSHAGLKFHFVGHFPEGIVAQVHRFTKHINITGSGFLI